MKPLAICLALALCLGSSAAWAQGDYFDKSEAADEVTYRVDQPRTSQAWIAIGILGGATLVSGTAGLLFKLSGDGQADEVEAAEHVGRTWGEREQQAYDRAVFRRQLGWVGIGIAGGFAIATAVTWIVTDPGTKIIRVNTDTGERSASVDVVPGGAIVGARVSF